MKIQDTLVYKLCLDRLLEEVKNSSDTVSYEDILQGAFNTIENYMPLSEVEDFLAEDGVFNWIQFITEKEKEHFGEVTFDTWYDPNSVLNMAIYFVGDELFYEMLDECAISIEWDNDDTTKETACKWLEEKINFYS